jgi:hypothetical protein
VGVGEGALVGLRAARPDTLALRLWLGFLVADQIEADGRADHVALAHQVEMVEVAGLDQVLERQGRESAS